MLIGRFGQDKLDFARVSMMRYSEMGEVLQEVRPAALSDVMKELLVRASATDEQFLGSKERLREGPQADGVGSAARPWAG